MINLRHQQVIKYVFLMKLIYAYALYQQLLAATREKAAKEKEQTEKNCISENLSAFEKRTSGHKENSTPESAGESTPETNIESGFEGILNAVSCQRGCFLQHDPLGYQDSMNLYQAMNSNPWNFLDPNGEWARSVHHELTRSVYSFAKSFINPQHGLDPASLTKFQAGLMHGCFWPDLPNGLVEFGMVFTVDGNASSIAPKNSLTYRSHFGDLQHWHAMQAGDRSVEETKRLMIMDITGWLTEAHRLLHGSKKSFFGTKYFYDLLRFEMAGELTGRALHLIEDSYTPSHAKRDRGSMKIIEFQNYKNQDPKEHKKDDFVTKKTIKYYEKAQESVKRIANTLFRQKDRNAFKAELITILAEILETK